MFRRRDGVLGGKLFPFVVRERCLELFEPSFLFLFRQKPAVLFLIGLRADVFGVQAGFLEFVPDFPVGTYHPVGGVVQLQLQVYLAVDFRMEPTASCGVERLGIYPFPETVVLLSAFLFAVLVKIRDADVVAVLVQIIFPVDGVALFVYIVALHFEGFPFPVGPLPFGHGEMHVEVVRLEVDGVLAWAGKFFGEAQRHPLGAFGCLLPREAVGQRDIEMRPVALASFLEASVQVVVHVLPAFLRRDRPVPVRTAPVVGDDVRSPDDRAVLVRTVDGPAGGFVQQRLVSVV